MANAFMYSSILVLLAAIASTGYQPKDVASDQANIDATGASVVEATKPSVDEIAAADLAANVAEVASLSVKNDVSNASITLNVKNELSQVDEAVITKPQTFETVSSSAITSYKAVAGDTVPSVAAKYSITSQTLKWANNLVSDVLTPDQDLLIPSTDGVVYVVKAGDTVESIATKYQSDTARITSVNDLEISGITEGQRILLPGGVLPESEQPGYVAPRKASKSSSSSYSSRSSNPMYSVQSGNRYSYGYCTWYAYNRRAQIGRPIMSLWGNASSWAYAAASAGYTVARGNPGVGDVMQNGGGAGHVAVVEEVRADGSIMVSEMNWYGNGGGWNRISYRELDAGAASAYTFIK